MNTKKQERKFYLNIQCYIALIDELIGRQLNIIIHNKKLQQLEASWRGLNYLILQTEKGETRKVKIKLLNISWGVFKRDLARAIEFDQSELFNKIYSQEFDRPGGEPFGLLIGDYYLSHDINELRSLRIFAKIAAAAFVPFIAAADPSIFGLENFANLQSIRDLYQLFRQDEYVVWRQFRQDENARFIGLVLPHVLMRLPYKGYFAEKNYQLRDYLWGNAVYCFAAVVTRSFDQSGWLADIRGVEQDKICGGLVTDLPRYMGKHSTDICVTDLQEKKIADLGLIPLCECNYVSLSVFYSCQSMQLVEVHRLSSMLHYMLCVSRFAHYIKVIVRDKIGSFINTEECERYLEKWLLQYTAAGENLTAELKAEFPLCKSSVKIQARPEKPGSYLCFIHLQPHYQFDYIESNLKLVTELIVG